MSNCSASTIQHDAQVSQLLQQLGARRIEPNSRLRGHDFFPPRDALALVPSVRAARRQAPADRVLWLHYFTADCDWFVAGFDPRTGQAYGYTDEPGIDLHRASVLPPGVLSRTDCPAPYPSSLLS